VTLKQCVCYSNDSSTLSKAFFQEKKVERTFHVSNFVRIVDNKGNEFHLIAQPDGQGQFIDVRSQGKGDLYPGEELVIEVEVDESFARYTVNWMTFNGDSGKGPVAHLSIEQKHINWPSFGGVLLDRCKLLSYVLQKCTVSSRIYF
jgi:hypothetical protein